jgi:hypothetical protein
MAIRFWSPTKAKKSLHSQQRYDVCEACSRGDFGEALYLLESADDVGPGQTDGSNALHYAAAAHRTDVVRALLAVRPDLVRCPRRDGWLPLHAAASALGSVPSVLRTGCVAALSGDHAGTVALLLAAAPGAAAVRGALDQRSPLHIALLTRAPEEVVLQLLAASPGMVAEPLRDVYSHKKGEGAETPLHTAILRHRRATTIVRMIELGGAVAAALLNSRGEAPLHCALAAGAEPAVFAALVNAAPATVGRRNRQNETALDLAVRHAAPREVFDLMLAASAKPSWLPGNGGKSLIERLIFDHAKIPRAAEYTRSVLRVAPQVAAKLKKGPISPLLHLALRRSADAATVDAILGAAPRIASGAHLDHKGSGIIELALAWYTRTEATPLAASLGAAMRRRGGGGGGEASACLASQTPCNDAALAKAEVIAHILFRLVRSPMVGPATAAPPIVCACWIAMQRSKLFLVAADQFRKHGPSAERAALFATIFQFMRGVEK